VMPHRPLRNRVAEFVSRHVRSLVVASRLVRRTPCRDHSDQGKAAPRPHLGRGQAATIRSAPVRHCPRSWFDPRNAP
jgi:hypothetical protein